MNSLINKLGGRKIFLSLIVFISTTILLSVSKLDSEQYFAIVKVLIVLYTGGNVLQSAFVKKSEDKKAAFVETLAETISDNQSVEDMVGRKFWFIVGIYITTVLLFVLKVLDSVTVFIDISNWIVGTYIVANVGDKAVTNGVTISINKSPVPPVDTK